MKIQLFLFVLFIKTLNLLGQKIDFSKDWLNQLEHPKYDIYVLKPDNYIDKYKTYNFSNLIIPKTLFIGYIGDNYQQIKIHFNYVIKDSIHNSYTIEGTSLVVDNKCNFSGTLIIRQIREYKSLHFGVDENYKDKGIKSQGILIGEYKFKENNKNRYSGEFSGIMSLNWYVNKIGELLVDDIENYSDNYRNNQYVGIWTEYETNIIKTCNWGEYRIPFSGDLDIGTGEFTPNPKYKDKGWK